MPTVVSVVGTKPTFRASRRVHNPAVCFSRLSATRPGCSGLSFGVNRQVAVDTAHNASRIRIVMQAASALEASQAPDTPVSINVKWECGITSIAPLLGDTGTGLEFIVLDIHSDLQSPVNKVDGWLRPALTETTDGASGWTRSGPITVPAEIRRPGAVLVRKLSSTPGQDAVDYISSIRLVNRSSVVTIPVDSWVAASQGWRVFFAGDAYLPKNTPPPLRDERARDLAQLQGTPETRTQERKGADRIYWYQTYDDVGNAKSPRPPLGGSKALPYPRRLANNASGTSDGKPWLPYDEQFSFNKEKGFQGDTLSGGLAAAFATIGELGNNSDLTWLNLLPTAIRGVIRAIVSRFVPWLLEPPLENFEDYRDVLAMFKLDADKSWGGFESLTPKNLYPVDLPMGMAAATAVNAPAKPFKRANGAWDFRLGKKEAKEANEKTAEERVGPVFDSAAGSVTAGARQSKQSDAAPQQPGAVAVVDRLGADVWRKVTQSSGDVNDLLYFNIPRVLEGRPDAWHSDEEYGRQVLAGYHAVTVTALTQTPESLGSAIRGEHVNAELQGSTLEQLVAEAAAGGKPRLFWQDYWALGAFWEDEEAAAGNGTGNGTKPPKGRAEHRGRALYYLRKDEQGNDKALIPVAFELASRDTHARFPKLPASAGIVYARERLVDDPHTLAIWRLAKAVFKSCDFSVHEVYSHFTRAHAVMEPFLIALRRNISTMHPVYKLMLPHFRYTLNINRNARTSLINAGGIIESCFTPGEYALRLGCALYGASWTFAGEALPDNLKARGMLDSEGRPWLDYPFATDGLDIWAAMTAYFDSYLRIYYKSNEDVLEDSELQAWWTEVKEEGHPDLVRFGIKTEEEVWGFRGPIPTLERLVHVLATVAWIGSGHHAAVNFGQYDYTSFVLNTSSLIRLPMPVPGDQAYNALVEAAPGDPQEGLIMKYLVDPFSAVKVMATVQLLSGHADDEQTLDEPNQNIVDPAARAANEAFIAAMKAQDLVVQTRNADPANWARYNLEGLTEAGGPLPYTLLQPSSGAGVTMRGVPYSVSI